MPGFYLFVEALQQVELAGIFNMMPLTFTQSSLDAQCLRAAAKRLS
jgi:hypothetical protein